MSDEKLEKKHSLSFYDSGLVEGGKSTVNIEDIVTNPALYAKTVAFILDLVAEPYGSKEEFDERLTRAINKHGVVPQNRLDVNLLYWRYLGEKKFPRNISFEKYSVAVETAAYGRSGAITDVEDFGEADLLQSDIFVESLVSRPMPTKLAYEKAVQLTRRQFKSSPSKLHLQKSYHRLLAKKKIVRNKDFERFAIKKTVRSTSGVLVITVLTSPFPSADGKPGRFDCAYDCAYCPNEPGMPRSYISTEPAVRRAIQNNWDPIEQFIDRVGMLAECGHVLDKFEVLVLGGTWSSYPMEYREAYVRDLYYTANCHLFLPEGERLIREKKSLAEEREMNETADHRIIGLTLETRPDCINKREIRHLRDCGCTRVQLGIQHTDDEILNKIKRQCTSKHNARGIRMLKEAGFKVDIHLMPDLPGSSVEQDLAMFKEVIYGEDLQADQWKIYPTSVVKHSLIEQWYNEGSYKPYSEEDKGNKLVELIINVKTQVPPWVRLNRVIRDIPEISILGGNDDTNMRQKLEMLMKQRGTPCNCIRCREVRDKDEDTKKAQLVVREYKASGGKEFFISFESPEIGRDKEAKVQTAIKRSLFFIFACMVAFVATLFRDLSMGTVQWAIVAMQLLMFTQAWRSRQLLFSIRKKGFRRETIYGFVRLRVNADPSENVFPELRNAALIRELHVYGRLTAVSDKSTDHIQHVGFGRRLLERAEMITRANGLHKIAVISGDGVKDYYRKVGFASEGQYLTKTLS